MRCLVCEAFDGKSASTRAQECYTVIPQRLSKSAHIFLSLNRPLMPPTLGTPLATACSSSRNVSSVLGLPATLPLKLGDSDRVDIVYDAV